MKSPVLRPRRCCSYHQIKASCAGSAACGLYRKEMDTFTAGDYCSTLGEATRSCRLHLQLDRTSNHPLTELASIKCSSASMIDCRALGDYRHRYFLYPMFLAFLAERYLPKYYLSSKTAALPGLQWLSASGGSR